MCRKALDLDPTNYLPQWGIGWIDIQIGKFSDAIPELQKATATDAPALVTGYLGYAYGASGDRNHARATIEELKKRSLDGYVPAFNLAIVYLGLGDRERALIGLEQAYSDHSQELEWAKMDKMFDPLRSEPRFVELMKKVGLDK